MCKKRIVLFLTCLLILAGALLLSAWTNGTVAGTISGKIKGNVMQEGMKEIKYTTEDGETGYVYVPDAVLSNPNVKVPMVVAMSWTGGEARGSAKSCGWIDKALEENFIVLAPEYDNSETYSQTDRLTSAIEYIIKTYPIDETRVYSTGFSNGGATSVALTGDYPKLFAAISAMGWMVDLQASDENYAAYDMPFQVIQGTKEFTYKTDSGAMAVTEDEQKAIRSLLLYNEMIAPSLLADYDKTPYFGYVPADCNTANIGGKKWTFNQFYKDGYTSPFAQFILIPGAEHEPNKDEATVAWNFMKHYSRSADGTIIETVEAK